MKLIRSLMLVSLVATIVGTAGAQSSIRRGHAHNSVTTSNPAVTQAISSLQQDLIAAVAAMKAALPIYEGNRVRSIHAAHASLVIVDHVMYGKNAAVRPKPSVTDHVAAKHAKSKYTAQQIEASQESMKQGLAALQAAVKDLQVAEGNTPNRQGAIVSNHLQKAIQDATTAISLHANQA
ncbi:MAG: hypothetical protein P4L46_22605 [Fimbriimonas sp.]|nr:hypothetical protein [Fimbriimonas sp.]